MNVSKLKLNRILGEQCKSKVKFNRYLRKKGMLYCSKPKRFSYESGLLLNVLNNPLGPKPKRILSAVIPKSISKL